MADPLPTETTCSDCGTAVFLDPRAWLVEDERGGANNLCRCSRCGSMVLGVVGSRQYVQRTLIKFGAFIAQHRECYTH